MTQYTDRVTHSLICIAVYIGWFALPFVLIFFPNTVELYRSDLAGPVLGLLFWLPYSLLCWRSYQKKFNLMPLGKLRLADLILPVLAISALIWIDGVLGIEESWTSNLVYLPAFTVFLHIIVICIVAPIVEEIIFRGFLLNAGMGYGEKGKQIAIIMTSLLFSAGHMQYSSPTTFVVLFVFSVILCHVRIHTRSLIVPMVLHALNNILAVSYNY
ncbi:CPBP family intramembrane glutamic endopeptidase [Xenorhabdus innexi]|uniref:Putative membrane protein n=1 Tax=Xenorhabdus innexi TaxID=290109 RepID=A0A1N6MRU0_9GAMM|nr:type II CAAX endopeptidase family protein [Xenorhabdus innexi]PHM38457.1 Tir [Xenorhabdus innexi]SIP71449.1 putative membrane protein [Xenorhabdus innexi]